MNIERLRDVPPGYEYLRIKHNEEFGNPEKIWGVYCTYWRYEWERPESTYRHIDDALIFWGKINGPIYYKFGVDSRRLYSYNRRREKEKYDVLQLDDFINLRMFDNVREGVSKRMMWQILRK